MMQTLGERKLNRRLIRWRCLAKQLTISVYCIVPTFPASQSVGTAAAIGESSGLNSRHRREPLKIRLRHRCFITQRHAEVEMPQNRNRFCRLSGGFVGAAKRKLEISTNRLAILLKQRDR